MAKDMLGQKLKLNDLVAWGNSGRYAGTQIGRIYKVEEKSIRAWIFVWRKEGWVRAHHAGPCDPVKLAEVEGAPPKLDEAQLKR